MKWVYVILWMTVEYTKSKKFREHRVSTEWGNR
jgi:hypothetical protein